MLYATSEGVVLLDLKERKNSFSSQSLIRGLWIFLTQRVGWVGGQGREYFAAISKDFADLRLPEYPQTMWTCFWLVHSRLSYATRVCYGREECAIKRASERWLIGHLLDNYDQNSFLFFSFIFKFGHPSDPSLYLLKKAKPCRLLVAVVKWCHHANGLLRNRTCHGVFTIYGNIPGGNLVNKHKTIKFNVVEEISGASKYSK